MFQPNYKISKQTLNSLLKIEEVRRALRGVAIPPTALLSLRESAALNSAHFSTQIEGNRLTLPEVMAVKNNKAKFTGRERDTSEVENHFAAHSYMETLATKATSITEVKIQILHGLVFFGKEKPTPYRNQQNVIREAGSGRIVYLPPEASDVASLMQELVSFINIETKEDQTPAPIVAALAHYQFATIHPYIDGNGRTVRLLTNLVLHRAGYGLKGIYSLDEYYAENLNGYYQALSIGHHNYYEGRAEADITNFIDYFISGMAASFVKILNATKAHVGVVTPLSQTPNLRDLDLKQRKLLPYLQANHSGTTADFASVLKLSHASLLVLCRAWVKEGFLEIENPSRKGRSYRLGQKYVLMN